MTNFDSFGKLSPVAQKTFAIWNGDPDKTNAAWDFFLGATACTDPDIYPSCEEIESENLLRDYTCEDLNFRVYQNIVRENGILSVDDSYVCADLFKYLDAYNITGIEICNIFKPLGTVLIEFFSRGWALDSFSIPERTVTFKKH